MEVAHNYPHEIVIFHNVLSNAEADGVIAHALPLIQRAVVGNFFKYIATEYRY